MTSTPRSRASRSSSRARGSSSSPQGPRTRGGCTPPSARVAGRRLTTASSQVRRRNLCLPKDGRHARRLTFLQARPTRARSSAASTRQGAVLPRRDREKLLAVIERGSATSTPSTRWWGSSRRAVEDAGKGWDEGCRGEASLGIPSCRAHTRVDSTGSAVGQRIDGSERDAPDRRCARAT